MSARPGSTLCLVLWIPLLLGLFVSSGCGGDDGVEEPASPVDLAREWREAYNDRDLRALEQLLDPEATQTIDAEVLGYEESELVGREAVLDNWVNVWANEDPRITSTEILDVEDRTVTVSSTVEYSDGTVTRNTAVDSFTDEGLLIRKDIVVEEILIHGG